MFQGRELWGDGGMSAAGLDGDRENLWEGSRLGWERSRPGFEGGFEVVLSIVQLKTGHSS